MPPGVAAAPSAAVPAAAPLLAVRFSGAGKSQLPSTEEATNESGKPLEAGRETERGGGGDPTPLPSDSFSGRSTLDRQSASQAEHRAAMGGSFASLSARFATTAKNVHVLISPTAFEGDDTGRIVMDQEQDFSSFRFPRGASGGSSTRLHEKGATLMRQATARFGKVAPSPPPHSALGSKDATEAKLSDSTAAQLSGSLSLSDRSEEIVDLCGVGKAFIHADASLLASSFFDISSELFLVRPQASSVGAGRRQISGALAGGPIPEPLLVQKYGDDNVVIVVYKEKLGAKGAKGGGTTCSAPVVELLLQFVLVKEEGGEGRGALGIFFSAFDEAFLDKGGVERLSRLRREAIAEQFNLFRGREAGCLILVSLRRSDKGNTVLFILASELLSPLHTYAQFPPFCF